MIILRRILAVFLAFIFVILFIPVLVVYRVNGTVASPGFYTDQLRRADIYKFVDNELLPAALQNVQLGAGSMDLSALKPQMVAIAQQTLPPQWLQAQSEQVINAFVPYVTGSTPALSVNIPLKDRVQTAAAAIKSALHQPGVFTRIYDQAIDSLVTVPSTGLPLGLTAVDMKSIVRTVLPADWVLKQLDSALDEAVPYFIKDKEHFTVRVNLLERVDFFKAAVTDIMKRPATYDYIMSEVVTRPLSQSLQQASQFGVTLTSQDIAAVVKQVLPLDWYQARVPGIVDQLFAYLSGTQSSLTITIPVADRKPAMADAVGRLIAQKLGISYDSLPAFLKSLLTTVVTSALPDQIQLTETQLVGSTGADNPLAQARKLLTQGYSYTDQDLSTSMGVTQLDNMRQYLASGFTFTDKDLANWTQGGISTVRSALGTVRGILAFAWLFPLLLLVGVGLLGGQGWGSKLMWLAAPLGAAALIGLILFGPVFSGVVQPLIEGALKPPAGDALQTLLLGKVSTLALDAVGTFIGGLKIQTIIFLVVALGLGVLGFIWSRRQGEA